LTRPVGVSRIALQSKRDGRNGGSKPGRDSLRDGSAAQVAADLPARSSHSPMRQTKCFRNVPPKAPSLSKNCLFFEGMVRVGRCFRHCPTQPQWVGRSAMSERPSFWPGSSFGLCSSRMCRRPDRADRVTTDICSDRPHYIIASASIPTRTNRPTRIRAKNIRRMLMKCADRDGGPLRNA
jgi:hypothetical protein